MKKRAYYLDLVRVFLTVIVFFHHSAIGFGASGGWYYKSKELTTGITQSLLSLLMGIEQSYFMSLFFFISALFMPDSFDRKGPKSFWIDRTKRLFIPLIVFFFVLNPLLVYWIYGKWGEFGAGPMWFVLTLLLFELAYTLYRTLCPKRISIKWEKISTFGILTFMLLSGIVAFTIRLFCPAGKNVFWLQLGYFSLYIFMYALGIVAGRNHWLDRLKLKNAMPWFLISVFIGIPVLMFASLFSAGHPEYFNGGWNLQSLTYSMWEPVMCVGICYFLLTFSRKYFNKPNSLIQRLSADSYAFYIIHPFFVVGITFLSEGLPFSPLMRLVFVLIIGIPLCFLGAHGLRLLTGKRWI